MQSDKAIHKTIVIDDELGRPPMRSSSFWVVTLIAVTVPISQVRHFHSCTGWVLPLAAAAGGWVIFFRVLRDNTSLSLRTTDPEERRLLKKARDFTFSLATLLAAACPMGRF